MARLPDVITDPSALSDPTVNVRLRVGWLLRTSRLNAADSAHLRGNAIAQEIGVNPALVTRWEKGVEDVDAAGIDAYERVTGARPGTLRGAIDVVRRTWRHRAGGRSSVAADPDLDRVSSLVWPAMHGEPRGIDWLNFADALGDAGPLALPEFTAAPVIGRLAGELSRSVGTAYQTRYEALARLRSGRYGTVALRSLLGLALADDAQVGVHLLRVCAEKPSAQLISDMCRLLADTRTTVFEGACRSLDQMLTEHAIPVRDVSAAMPHLLLAYDVGSVDPERHRRLSALIRLLPPTVRGAVAAELSRPLAPEPPESPTPQPRSAQVRAADTAAREVLATLPVHDDEILARLIFEALFDAVPRKRHSAMHLLLALPYRDGVFAAIDALLEHESAAVRAAAADFGQLLGTPRGLAVAEARLLAADPAQRVAALTTLGRWSEGVEPAVLEKSAADGPELRRHALFAAGMTRSTLLREWANDPAKPEQVQAGARWWLRNGGRITD